MKLFNKTRKVDKKNCMMIWDWSFFPHNSKNVDLIKLVTEFDNYEEHFV